MRTRSASGPTFVCCYSKSDQKCCVAANDANAISGLTQCSKQDCQVEMWWMSSRLRHTSQELASEPSENVLDRRGRSDVKGFIENLTQLIDAFD
jgi:hypothetical protein